MDAVLSASAVDTLSTVVNVLLIAGSAEVLAVLGIVWSIGRQARKDLSSGGEVATKDSGEAVSAPPRHCAATRASGSPSLAREAAPASPRPRLVELPTPAAPGPYIVELLPREVHEFGPGELEAAMATWTLPDFSSAAVGESFLAPDGMCKYCFRPRSECDHRPPEFVIST